MIGWVFIALVIGLIAAAVTKPGERKQAFSNAFRQVLVFVFVAFIVIAVGYFLVFGLALSIPTPNRNTEYQEQSPMLVPTARPTVRPTVRMTITRTVPEAVRQTARSTAIPVDYQCREYGTSNDYEFGSRYCETFTLDELFTFSVDHDITDADEYVVLSSSGYQVGMVSFNKISKDLNTKLMSLRQGCQVKIIGLAVPHPESPNNSITYIEQLSIVSCPNNSYPAEPGYEQGKCSPGWYEIKITGGDSYCAQIDSGPPDREPRNTWRDYKDDHQ